MAKTSTSRRFWRSSDSIARDNSKVSLTGQSLADRPHPRRHLSRHPHCDESLVDRLVHDSDRRRHGGPRPRSRLPQRQPPSRRQNPGMVERLVRRFSRLLLLLPAAVADHRVPGLVHALRGGVQGGHRHGPAGNAARRLLPGSLDATREAHLPGGSRCGRGLRLLRELFDLRGQHRLHACRRVRLLVVFRPLPALSRPAHPGGP